VFAPYPRDLTGVGSGREAALASSLYAVERALDRRAPAIGAVVVEPIQGRGGVHVPPARFLSELSALCQKHGALLVLDEVMTGLGRAGSMLASAPDAARALAPELHIDLVCLGKGLGGGLPVSACLGRKEVMLAWSEANSGSAEALHAGTFFGHALGCATALATLDVLEQEQLPARALALEAVVREELAGLSGLSVRGRGLLLGIELGDGSRALRVGRRLLERGYLTVPASADASVISLTPALSVAETQLRAFASALRETLAETA
jgi:4-aminobutyrate aminotransferase/(S)-3-amino-2-methylpropionate transaminase